MRVFYRAVPPSRFPGELTYEQAGPTVFCCRGMCERWGSLIDLGVPVSAVTRRPAPVHRFVNRLPQPWPARPVRMGSSKGPAVTLDILVYANTLEAGIESHFHAVPAAPFRRGAAGGRPDRRADRDVLPLTRTPPG